MERPLITLSYSLETIDEAAKQFWAAVQHYRVFAFSGEMGAGKTTFIHHLCDHLHVTDTVSSPTFALINEYHYTDAKGTGNIIYHLDWFRLRDSEEAFNAGMDECVDAARTGQATCFIEWPEKAEELLQLPYIHVRISTPGITERLMEVVLTGQ